MDGPVLNTFHTNLVVLPTLMEYMQYGFIALGLATIIIAGLVLLKQKVTLLTLFDLNVYEGKKIPAHRLTCRCETLIELRFGSITEKHLRLTFTIWSSIMSGPTKVRTVPKNTARTPTTMNPTATLDLLMAIAR